MNTPSTTENTPRTSHVLALAASIFLSGCQGLRNEMADIATRIAVVLHTDDTTDETSKFASDFEQALVNFNAQLIQEALEKIDATTQEGIQPNGSVIHCIPTDSEEISEDDARHLLGDMKEIDRDRNGLSDCFQYSTACSLTGTSIAQGTFTYSDLSTANFFTSDHATYAHCLQATNNPDPYTDYEVKAYLIKELGATETGLQTDGTFIGCSIDMTNYYYLLMPPEDHRRRITGNALISDASFRYISTPDDKTTGFFITCSSGTCCDITMAEKENGKGQKITCGRVSKKPFDQDHSGYQWVK